MKNDVSVVAEMARPLSFVVGRDFEVLPLLFKVHAPNAKKILDVTYNQGKCTPT
jgi:hypothetical protein